MKDRKIWQEICHLIYITFLRVVPDQVFIFSILYDLLADLRLQGPLSQNGTGRVEILYNGQWGTVCDDQWDMKDAMVVCRQLGYEYAVRTLGGSDIPDGTGPIWLDEVTCAGSERNLSSCTHNVLGKTNCRHHEDAGVECSSTGKVILGIFSESIGQVCFEANGVI